MEAYGSLWKPTDYNSIIKHMHKYASAPLEFSWNIIFGQAVSTRCGTSKQTPEFQVYTYQCLLPEVFGDLEIPPREALVLSM